MKKLLLVAVLLWAGCAFAEDVRILVQRSKPAVVHIATFNKEGKLLATGTGFFISADGYLVTNYHVVDGASSILARDYKGTVFHVFPSKDQWYIETPLAAGQIEDPDVILLRADATNVPYLKLGSTANEVEGQRILTIGNPMNEEFSISDGLISAFRDNRSIIQITAPISHGSSGSPVLDCDSGEVIGIATWVSKEGQNLNYAITSEKIRDVIAKTGSISQTPPVAKATPTPEPPPVVVTPPTPRWTPPATDHIISSSDSNAQKVADDYYLRGHSECMAGNYQSAIEFFTETIRLWPRSYRAYEGRAAAYNGLGNFTQAALDMAEARQLRKSK